ncbi:hypothetical protein JCM21900_000680 [Sporobolomyces salmonicolor]
MVFKRSVDFTQVECNNWPLFFKLSDILDSWNLVWTNPTTRCFDQFVSLDCHHVFRSPTTEQHKVLTSVICTTFPGSVTLFTALCRTIFLNRRQELTQLSLSDLRDVDQEWQELEEGLLKKLKEDARDWKWARTRMDQAGVTGPAPVADATDPTVVDFMLHSQTAWKQWAFFLTSFRFPSWRC